jgi:hypothetical protein
MRQGIVRLLCVIISIGAIGAFLMEEPGSDSEMSQRLVLIALCTTLYAVLGDRLLGGHWTCPSPPDSNAPTLCGD